MAQAWDFVDDVILWRDLRNRQPSPPGILSMRVADIEWNAPEVGVTTRIVNALANEGIETVADLVTRTTAELLRMPNFGRKSLNGINNFLAEHGLHLGMDV
jgi:DNA-directed RNA polymerase alpha subunit